MSLMIVVGMWGACESGRLEWVRKGPCGCESGWWDSVDVNQGGRTGFRAGVSQGGRTGFRAGVIQGGGTGVPCGCASGVPCIKEVPPETHPRSNMVQVSSV